MTPAGSGTFSVVIATYDTARAPLLRRCVDALIAGTVRPHEVLIIVDTDHALSQQLRGEVSGVVRVLDSEGKGASATRNTGLGVASGEFVLCLDDDTLPAPDLLEAYGEAFARLPEVVALGGHIIPDYELGGRDVPPEILWLVGSTYRGHRADSGPITRPIGANMAFRRDAILAVGGFDPDFGPTGPTRLNSNEEIELSESLRRKFGSESIWYIREARVSHYVPLRRTTLRYLIERCRAEGSSKARVRRRYGRDVMAHDATYVRHVLLPAIASQLARGILTFNATCLGDAFRLVLASTITASTYASTLLRTAASKQAN